MTSGRLSHYDVLGVSRTATSKDINMAYKKLSLSLHPDRNKFGGELMKQINEAKEVLSDDEKRRQYDRELDSGRSQESSRTWQSPSSPDTTRLLKQQLRDSEKKRRVLNMRVTALEIEVSDARRNLNIALQVERMKSRVDLAEEKKKANEKLQDLEKSLNERSLCFHCQGDAGDTCKLCNGYGLLHGKWTKCHKCGGEGTFTSISGTKQNCYACFSRGARQGAFTVKCFKCKGSGDCDVCFEGEIKGFNVKECPFCEGSGCENCHEKGYVSCQCGFTCSHIASASGSGVTTDSGLVKGTTSVPYVASIKRDGTNQYVFHAMTAMWHYEQKSFEELRMEDYSSGNYGMAPNFGTNH
mmetsp:Transcript_21842/g.46130  ORF Transcript_21842/g.46130 Transcript_21842/m.46130 type:complete len:355 (+) Transcript_21842:224-1288(+)|eukprot:CAMPEP_0183726900 /NCGR_PEP_ID=MMETSP0737-20130205/24386_1 /TAXON_ID=385413 /ORGANISM="Thalassiosira miniscula, Strain CCMP1093" /LENGTH=354 /DNA_ID=CAMNT_0025958371 /DNA_START=121 /DNA_END=1185 /DNA_ORIENTATION=+